jgi:polyisoprenoid-binding protein YceI
MKKTTVISFLVLLYSMANFSQQEVSINVEKSIINWKGSMLFSFGGHYGTVKFIDGKLIKTNSKITGGTFNIDMQTIINTDGDYSEDLIKHLKNEDFFNVEEYPKAKLVLTKVEYFSNGKLRMDAKLTIKGITNSIAFDAELNADNTKLNAKFKIDRTDWNITYGSKGIIKIKDYAISDAMEFEVELILN